MLSEFVSFYFSALPKIIKAGFAALQLEYFFTAGPDEVRAWTIRKGTKAPQAAGKIHTDFEKGFIMAEVMKYEDFKEEGSENAVKVRNYFLVSYLIIFADMKILMIQMNDNDLLNCVSVSVNYQLYVLSTEP